VAVFVSVVNQQATLPEEGVATRFTLPEKPPTLITVTTVCCSEPDVIVCDVGERVMVKSGI